MALAGAEKDGVSIGAKGWQAEGCRQWLDTALLFSWDCTTKLRICTDDHQCLCERLTSEFSLACPPPREIVNTHKVSHLPDCCCSCCCCQRADSFCFSFASRSHLRVFSHSPSVLHLVEHFQFLSATSLSQSVSAAPHCALT